MFRTVPLEVTPSLEDAETLRHARMRLADSLARHAARESRIVAGNASPETIDCVLSNRHLSQVLAGPRALIQAKG
jgi:hypothetical protein